MIASTTSSGGGGALSGLSDVLISGTPSDNEALAYDTNSGKFTNQAISSSGATATGAADKIQVSDGNGAFLESSASINSTSNNLTGVATYIGENIAITGSSSGSLTGIVAGDIGNNVYGGLSVPTGTLDAASVKMGYVATTLTQPTTLGVTMNMINIDMENLSYKVFNLELEVDLFTLNITNDVAGAQAIVFITVDNAVTGNLVIRGSTNDLGTNVYCGYSADITLDQSEYAVMTIVSDGSKRYVNVVKYEE